VIEKKENPFSKIFFGRGATNILSLPVLMEQHLPVKNSRLSVSVLPLIFDEEMSPTQALTAESHHYQSAVPFYYKLGCLQLEEVH
jgi:hypothetical protein